MGRYQNDIITTRSVEEANSTIKNLMDKEGFKNIVYKNENVWKKGAGFIVAPQFLKTEVTEGKVHIEAWIKFPLLPGVFVGEMGISGFVGVVPKQLLKDRVMTLESLLR